jgi:hypothetical protein
MTLPFGAEATVGGVINIGNGESIRFELSGSIRTEEELAGLLAGFDHTLERLGRGDELTRTAVDSFRARVFGENGKAAPKPAPTPAKIERVVASSDTVTITRSEPAPKPAQAPEAPAEFVCDDCKGPVTKDEARVSKLFLSASLCKGCAARRSEDDT